IAERRIGMVMDVARTSMIHAAAPHFLWSFAVQYAVHHINLQPRVSLPETSPTLRWTGKVGDASVFRVWGSRAFVRDLSADKLSSRAVPCAFLGFPPDALGWQFYHPTSRCVLSSQDVMFDESVPYYRLFPYRTAPLPPPPHFLAPGPPHDAVEPVEVAADSGASGGAEPERAEPRGAESGGAEPEREESGGAEPGGAEPEHAEPGGAASGGAKPRAAGSGGVEPAGAGPGGPSGALSRRELPSPQELREWFAHHWSHAAGAGGAAAPRGSAATRGPGAGGPSGAGTGGSTSAGGAGATGPGGARTGGTGAAGPAGAPGAGAGGAAGVGAAGGTGAGAGVSAGGPTGAGAAGVTGASGAAGGGADAGGTGFIPAGPVGAARPRPYFVADPESSLPALADPASNSLRAASPTVTRLLAIVVTDPSFESTAASALLSELVEFAAHCRLDHAVSLVAESASVCPPSVGAMDAEMASWKSTGTYVDEVPPLGANIVSGMWIFRVKRPPGSPPVFKARYMARGFSQRQGVDYFQTFSPTPKMTTLRVLLHVAAQHDYELHSLDFSTAFLQGSLHEEIWLRRPPGFTGSFPAGTQWSLRRPVYGLRQAPPLPSDESVEPSGPYPELVGCLMYLMTCTRPDLAYPLSILARYVAPGRHRPEHLAAAKRVLRYLCSTSGMGLVLGGRSPVVLTGHADVSWVDDMATQRSSQGYTFSLGVTLAHLLAD
ncbi:unnamed protein product, partial [Closterium sp. NIES-54]